MKTKRKSHLLAAELTDSIRGFKAPDLAKQVLRENSVAELIDCALSDDQLLSSRAMWVLGHCSDLDSQAVEPYYNVLIENLEKPGLHNGVVRNTLRLFQEQVPPEKYQTFLLDKCYGYISDPAEAIAVRAFAIRVVYLIAEAYPELLSELKTVLSHLPEQEESPGIRSRVRNTLKAIAKLQKKKSN